MVVEVDEVFRALGRPGRYHIFVYIPLACYYFPVVLNHLSMAIYGAKTPYSCKLPPGKSRNESAPTTEDAEECFVYANFSRESNQTIGCIHGWIYHTGPKENNIIMEWDLVCDHSYLVNLSTSIYFVGVMLGGLFFGSLSDYFGRKPIMLTCLYSQIAVGIGLSFVKSYIAFVLLHFVLGTLMQGLQTSSIVLIIELFTPEHRTAAGVLCSTCFAIGVMYLAGISYALQNWRYIQLAITLPSLVTITYIWIVPESLRWLVVHKKYKAAENMVKKAAKFNKVVMGDDPLGLKEKQNADDFSSKAADTREDKNNNILDMFKTPCLRKRSFILFYIWFVNAIGYYGITYYITSLAGNKYLNLFIGGVVELPIACASVPIFKRFGRRKPLAIYMLTGGVLCIASGSIPSKEVSGINLALVSTSLAILGRVGMAGIFIVGFVYTSELYPTVIRNISLSTCTFWGRVGSMVSPQVLRLGTYFHALPVLVIGSMVLLGGFLTLLLPETLNEKLPETMDHVKQSKPEEPGNQCTRL